MNSKFRIILRAILSILFSIGVVYMSPKLMHMNKEEIDPIIKIEDYGFTDIEIYDSLLGKSKFENKVGMAYRFRFDCTDSSNSYYISVMTYEWDDNEIARKHFEDQIEKVRQDYIKRISGSLFSETIVPKLPYDKAIEYMFPVDLNEWNVDIGYSTTDIYNDETTLSYVVLLESNQVMVITDYDNIVSNQNYIKIFNDLFEKSDTLFQ